MGVGFELHCNRICSSFTAFVKDLLRLEYALLAFLSKFEPLCSPLAPGPAPPLAKNEGHRRSVSSLAAGSHRVYMVSGGTPPELGCRGSVRCRIVCGRGLGLRL